MKVLPSTYWILLLFCQPVLASLPAGYVITWRHNYLADTNGVAAPSKFTTDVVTIAGQELTNAVAIAAGDNHGLALRSDGTVVAWGSNQFGQTSVPQEVSNVVRIVADGAYNVAIMSDGTGIGWGAGQPPELTELSNIVAASYYVELKTDGRLVSRGREFKNRPVFVPAGLTNVVDFTMKYGEGLALRRDGTVVEWESIGPIPVEYKPTEWTNGRVIAYRILPADYKVIDGLSNVTAIASMGGFSLALKRDGTVFGWGDNRGGVATGVEETNSPISWGPYFWDRWSSQGLVTLGGHVLSNVTAIATGHGMSLALKDDGTIATWGDGPYHRVDAPPGLSNVVAIAISTADRDVFGLAITTNRAVAEKFMHK